MSAEIQSEMEKVVDELKRTRELERIAVSRSADELMKFVMENEINDPFLNKKTINNLQSKSIGKCITM